MNKRKAIFILLITLIAAAMVVGVLEAANVTNLFSKDTDSSKINYEPATKEELKDSESHKDKPGTSEPTPSTDDDSNKKIVTVQITTYSSKTEKNTVSVNGFVSDVIEEGGTCTLVLTSKEDGKMVKADHPGEANATNTTCGKTEIPISSLHSGDWQAVLKYSSSTSAGTSEPLMITVD